MNIKNTKIERWNNAKIFSIIKKFFLWINFKKFRVTKIKKKYKEYKKPKASYICDKTFPFLVFVKVWKWRWKNISRRRINWDIKSYWFNWKYIITLKTWVKNLD